MPAAQTKRREVKLFIDPKGGSDGGDDPLMGTRSFPFRTWPRLQRWLEETGRPKDGEALVVTMLSGMWRDDPPVSWPSGVTAIVGEEHLYPFAESRLRRDLVEANRAVFAADLTRHTARDMALTAPMAPVIVPMPPRGNRAERRAAASLNRGRKRGS